MSESQPTQTKDTLSFQSLPGDPMMWILVGSEIVAFVAILFVFSVMALVEPEVFEPGFATMNLGLAGGNTLALLTSGLFVALAQVAIDDNRQAKARLLLVPAALLGVVFIALKLVEYQQKWKAGFSIDTNNFYALYFLITGFHFAHVIFGLVLLGIAAIWMTAANLRSVAVFWHMVDLIWLLIFGIVYVVG